MSLKDVYLYQQNRLIANNQISEQKLLIYLSISSLESERENIYFDNSGGKLKIGVQKKKKKKSRQGISKICVTLDQVDHI